MNTFSSLTQIERHVVALARGGFIAGCMAAPLGLTRPQLISIVYRLRAAGHLTITHDILFSHTEDGTIVGWLIQSS